MYVKYPDPSPWGLYLSTSHNIILVYWTIFPFKGGQTVADIWKRKLAKYGNKTGKCGLLSDPFIKWDIGLPKTYKVFFSGSKTHGRKDSAAGKLNK